MTFFFGGMRRVEFGGDAAHVTSELGLGLDWGALAEVFAV